MCDCVRCRQAITFPQAQASLTTRAVCWIPSTRPIHHHCIRVGCEAFSQKMIPYSNRPEQETFAQCSKLIPCWILNQRALRVLRGIKLHGGKGHPLFFKHVFGLTVLWTCGRQNHWGNAASLDGAYSRSSSRVSLFDWAPSFVCSTVLLSVLLGAKGIATGNKGITTRSK